MFETEDQGVCDGAKMGSDVSKALDASKEPPCKLTLVHVQQAERLAARKRTEQTKVTLCRD